MDPIQQPTPTPSTDPTPAPATPPEALPTTPAPAQPAAAPTTEDPGKTMGIVGFVLAFLIPLAGLIVSIIAKSKSKKAGHANGLALAGIIISAIGMVLGVLFFLLVVLGAGAAVQYCTENPNAEECTSSSYETN